MILVDENKRVLIYGIGNVGRSDDGLGIRFAEKVSQLFARPNLHVEMSYQLNVEDALQIAEFDQVIFVDASREPAQGRSFSWQNIEASPELSFTTHAMNAAHVLALCEQLYKKHPECFVLGIFGENWEIGEDLSSYALRNLKTALGAFHA